MGEIIKKIRMVMNILFIIAAISGMVLWYYGEHEIGKVVIIAAIILKFAESALRMMNVFNKPNEQ
ncbi:MAG: hypothetical protein ACI3YL_06715 [Prevotella sp.]|nr:hypothetical protein [Prevotella sp.]MCI5854488.1 hypothetical protein [Prevotella sp.]MDD6738228.1 hypothetical protein [Prevotella sp.]MDY6093258.1 hypothetical protein [Prevotella sp.]